MHSAKVWATQITQSNSPNIGGSILSFEKLDELQTNPRFQNWANKKNELNFYFLPC
jgi:hypothetical protein